MFVEDARVKHNSYYGLGKKNFCKSCNDDGMKLNSATLKYRVTPSSICILLKLCICTVGIAVNVRDLRV